jgi:hypothetical protein
MESYALFLQSILGPISVGLVSLSGALGLLALTCPRGFQALSTKCNQWVDTPLQMWANKKWIDMDHHFSASAYCRLMGALILTLAVLFAINTGIVSPAGSLG